MGSEGERVAEGGLQVEKFIGFLNTGELVRKQVAIKGTKYRWNKAAKVVK